LASDRLVANTVSPAAWASAIAAVATPPPAPCTSARSPGRTPARENSIRYAVSQATGRQAASSKDSSAGLGSRFARGTPTRSANVPSYTSVRIDTAGSRVSSPPPATGSPITEWTTTSFPSSSTPAASQPRTTGGSVRSPTPRSVQRSWWLSAPPGR
jgi:hypothetical protein